MKDSKEPDLESERTPTAVLPHTGAMVVLDEILEYDSDRVAAAATIRPSSLFLKGDKRVPAWIGLEYMAQCIAAGEGIRARRSGQPIRVGYLIATRRYTAEGGGFLLGDRLEVTATRVQDEGPLAVFDCTIDSRHCAVRASVTVYRSEEAADSRSVGG